MNKFFRKRLKKLDVHTLEILVKGSSSMLVRVLGVLARLLASVFLGRILGAEGLGAINIVNQVVTVVMVFSMLGMDNVLIKQISIATSQNDDDKIYNSVYSAQIINGLAALVLSILGILTSKYLSNNIFKIQELYIPFIIVFSVLIPQTLGRVLIASLNGLRRVWESNFFKESLTSIIVCIGLVIYWILDVEFSLTSVIFLYFLGRLVTFVGTRLYWKKCFKSKSEVKSFDNSMIPQALPLLFVAATSNIMASADVIMLGWLSNAKETGLYTIATRLALFILFFQQAANSAISPKIAALFAKNELDGINLMVKRVTKGLILIGVLFSVIFIFAGKIILSMWGTEFIAAYSVLIVLGISQVINTSTGCSGVILVMCGYSKIHSYISGICVLINLVLNYILIINLGAIGAALATGITIIFESILKIFFAKKYTGISTFPI